MRRMPPVFSTTIWTLSAFSLALSRVLASETLLASILTLASAQVRTSIDPEMLLIMILPSRARSSILSNFCSNFSLADNPRGYTARASRTPITTARRMFLAFLMVFLLQWLRL